MENGQANSGWEGSVLQVFVDSSLQVLTYVVLVGFFIWMVLALLSYLHRRAYNLTQAETASSGKAPDFLDNTGRTESIRDDAKPFDERMAVEAEQNSPEKTKKIRGLVRGITSFAAILTFIVAIVGAVGRIQVYDTTLQNISSMGHFVEIIQDFWIGALVAGLIVLVQLIRLVFSFRN